VSPPELSRQQSAQNVTVRHRVDRAHRAAPAARRITILVKCVSTIPSARHHAVHHQNYAA